VHIRIKRSLNLITTTLVAGLFGAPLSTIFLPTTAAAQTVLDIRNFGARCDGSDDTGAVQAALNSVPVGGTLNFSCLAGITQVSLSSRSNITLAGVNGGGVKLLTQTGDGWSRAFVLYYCSSCTVRDMVFEGNNKDMIPFGIDESSNTTVSGLTIRNVRDAGCAFNATHNIGNKYLNNTLQNVGMDRSPGAYDTARGMWIGGVSDQTQERNVTISGNNFADISATAIAVHGSGITITGNTGVRLNWSCIKVLPLGGTGSTLVANNNCSGAGALWQIGGSIMTEYYNSSYENTVIRDNVLEGYSDADVTRIPDSPNVGINVANPPDKMTHNVQILNNKIRNMLYDAVQISGPTDNFVVEGNLLERTISTGKQWTAISLQGDTGKVISNGTIRRNQTKGKFDGIYFNGNGGTIYNIALDSNSMNSMSRDGIHIEVANNGQVSGLTLTNNCFTGIGNWTIWDNRSNPLQPLPASASCPDPTVSATLTAPTIVAPTTGSTATGTVTLSATPGNATAGLQFKIDGAVYGSQLTSSPYSVSWDSRTSSNGTHQITAEAWDTAGNRATSAVATVTVSNPVPDTTSPTVSITSPAAGTVSGTVTLSASASDNVGVAGVQFLIDGVATGTEVTAAPYSTTWNSASVANGSHTISARARDAAGNKTTSAVVTVTVSNGDTTAPKVSITSPTAGQTASGTITLTASASDNVGVAGVQFLVDGAAYGAESTSGYSVSCNTTTLSNGSHTISAIARDAAGNRTTATAVTINVSNTITSTPITTTTVVARINAGGGAYTDTVGNAWAADSGYNGGSTFAPGIAVSGTTAPGVYQTQRWNYGSLIYSLNVANGNYVVNLKFAELWVKAAGQRVFNININGQRVLSNFDIFAAAGAFAKAVDKSFQVSVSGGLLTIEMAGVVENPTVCGIEVLKAATTTPKTVIRVNAGGGAYTDSLGNNWSADSGYSGGSTFAPGVAVSGTTAPDVYQAQRWDYNSLSYSFTVPNGTYTVNLKFAELWVKAAGQRVFNININGQRVLSSFDIFSAAGGFAKAVDRPFTVAVTGGKIAIDMASTVENPTVSGIEIYN
jgi:hypothetical protein